MTLNMDDDLDLSMRAPYISMSEADELPLLIAEDLMWGAQPEGLTIHKDIKQAISLNMKQVNYQQQANKQIESSLAALLCNGLLQQQQNQQNQMMEHQHNGEMMHENNGNMDNNGNQQNHHMASPQPEIKVKIIDHGSGFDQLANGYKNG